MSPQRVVGIIGSKPLKDGHAFSIGCKRLLAQPGGGQYGSDSAVIDAEILTQVLAMRPVWIVGIGGDRFADGKRLAQRFERLLALAREHENIADALVSHGKITPSLGVWVIQRDQFLADRERPAIIIKCLLPPSGINREVAKGHIGFGKIELGS